MFFTFRSCRQLDGRQAPIFENFPIRHIFLKFYFFNIKMKKSAFLGRPGTAAKDGPEYAALVFLPCSDLQDHRVCLPSKCPTFCSNDSRTNNSHTILGTCQVELFSARRFISRVVTTCPGITAKIYSAR